MFPGRGFGFCLQDPPDTLVFAVERLLTLPLLNLVYVLDPAIDDADVEVRQDDRDEAGPALKGACPGGKVVIGEANDRRSTGSSGTGGTSSSIIEPCDGDIDLALDKAPFCLLGSPTV